MSPVYFRPSTSLREVTSELHASLAPPHAMSTLEDLTAGLTSTTEAALSVRPSVGRRTASSRSLPRSTHPRVTICLPQSHIPTELRAGVEELARESCRGNVSVVPEGSSAPKGQGSLYVWTCGWVSFAAELVCRASAGADPRHYSFRKDESLPAGAMHITCNHDDFTLVPADEDFEVEIVYNRPIEGAYTSDRAHEHFTHPDRKPSAVSDMCWPSRAAFQPSSIPRRPRRTTCHSRRMAPPSRRSRLVSQVWSGAGTSGLSSRRRSSACSIRSGESTEWRALRVGDDCADP